ncbi:hypothetical protein LRY65_00350 [Candidatus Woesebacteria bacterium]|nr:hypothetical protein [Candidatus Woesebacteria bacterium]MCD8507766.1 hypothetical protein [Candidatus Woesebacteria bacterium]MCD8526656.1 hypothetical protein [Candidatus Woesebacteria bacterium]MCD8545876.1 hypothetical protein [Candidatus Woesebacteria bacterium]
MKHLLLALTVATALLLASAPTQVFANTSWQEQREINKTQFQNTVQNYQDRVDAAKTLNEERIEQRCSISTQRIDLWTTRYANNQSRFQKIEERAGQLIATIIERAKAAGKDTSELEAANDTFATKIDTASTEYSTLMDKLNASKEYACGNSEGAFRDSLQTAREQLIVTRQASLDARSYYQSTVRPAAQALLQNE